MEKSKHHTLTCTILSTFILCLSCHFVASTDYCSPPAKVGAAYTFRRTIEPLIGDFQWTYTTQAGQDRQVSKCSLEPNQVPTCGSIESGYVSSIEELDMGGYNVSLTIKNVTRPMHETSWITYGGNPLNLLSRCYLQVYEFESTPHCQGFEIVNKGTSSSPEMVLSWTCSISHVYPQPICLFQYKYWYDKIYELPTTVNEDRMDNDPDPNYHSITCTTTMNFTDLALNYNIFNVTMFPSVENTSPELGKSFQVERQFRIRSSKCDFSIVQNVLYFTCNFPSYFPGGFSIMLEIHKDNHYISPTIPGAVTHAPEFCSVIPPECNFQSTIAVNASEHNFVKGSFEFRVFLARKNWDYLYRKTFIYKDAPYYRGEVYKEMSLIKICQSAYTTFRVTCDVEARFVFRKPDVIVQGPNGRNVTAFKDHIDYNPRMYRFLFEVILPKVAGVYTLICFVMDPVIAEKNNIFEESITISGPPTSSPSMRIDSGLPIADGGVAIVNNGRKINVHCTVEEAFSVVFDISFTCITQHEHLSDVTEISPVTIYVSKAMNQQTCLCTAVHQSGCYNKSTEITLDVHYSPTVTNFTVNSKSDRQEVMAGANVILKCAADGNPKPNVVITRLRPTKELIQLEDSSLEHYAFWGQISQRMTCEDTDVYTCTAENSIGAGVGKDISMFVRCESQLASVEDKSIVFKPIDGNDVTINVAIYGYPQPSQFILTKTNEFSERKKRNGVGSEIVSGNYSVTYIPGIGPHGKVVLKMVDLEDKDSGQYVLTIKNGIGNGLQYTFNLEIGSASSNENSIDVMPIVVAMVAVFTVVITFIVVIVFIRKSNKKKKAARAIPPRRPPKPESNLVNTDQPRVPAEGCEETVDDESLGNQVYYNAHPNEEYGITQVSSAPTLPPRSKMDQDSVTNEPSTRIACQGSYDQLYNDSDDPPEGHYNTVIVSD